MKLTARDCRIISVLPAVVTVLAYLILLLRPALRQTAGLKNELASQDSPAVREERMARAQADNARLKSEFEAAKEVAAKGTGSTDAFVQGIHRAATLHDVSRLCEAAGLTLTSSSPVGDVSPAAGGGTGVRGLLDKAGWKNVEAWRLDLRGSYGGMLRMLNSVLADGVPIMPVGVNMEPAAEDAKPIAWSLIVWM
jgi:hypothetical protein